MNPHRPTQHHPRRHVGEVLLAAALVLVAGLAVAANALADDDDHVRFVERHKIVFAPEGGEVIEIDDLEVGESRQYFTDEGKEIVVSREDEGYTISVDGKEIDMPLHTSFHSQRVMVERLNEDGEGTEDVRKILLRTHDGHFPKAEHFSFVTRGAEDGAHQIRVFSGAGDVLWTSGDESAPVRLELKGGAAEHLLESGVLDDLDEAKRDEILEALAGYAGGPRSFFVIHEDDEAVDEN